MNPRILDEAQMELLGPAIIEQYPPPTVFLQIFVTAPYPHWLEVVSFSGDRFAQIEGKNGGLRAWILLSYRSAQFYRVFRVRDAEEAGGREKL